MKNRPGSKEPKEKEEKEEKRSEGEEEGRGHEEEEEMDGEEKKRRRGKRKTSLFISYEGREKVDSDSSQKTSFFYFLQSSLIVCLSF